MCLQFLRVWISLSQQCVWDETPPLHNFASLFCFPVNYRNCLLYMENLQVFSALEDNTISNSFSLERAAVHSVGGCVWLLLPKKDFPTALPNQNCGGNRHRCLRVRMAIANGRGKYGSSIAEWQPWSFPLASGSQPDPRPCQRIWVLQVHNNTSTI